MYTRSRQNQGYGNTRNANNSQVQGSYPMPYNTQGSYQASQSTSNQQSNYKQGNIQNSQGFKSQPQQQQQQQQQQQPAQLPPAAATRPLSTMAPTQLKSQMQQGQQQMLQQQPPPQQQMQQQPQQQQAPNPPPLPQRLKPILKQSTPTFVQPATTAAQITPVTSQPCVPPVVSAPTLFSDSTNNNSDVNDDSIKTEDADIEMQDVQPRWRRKIPGFKVNKKLKRLRMNQRLRKTLQPKNAIMVLNEMKAGVQFTFPETQGPMTNSLYLVHAELDGKTYVGQGLSKPLARQNAAENALKALLLEKMTAASMKARIDAESDGQANSSSDGIKEDSMNEDSTPMDTNTEDEIPWSSLASFALYKLFLEWHNQGTSVPVPRPGLPATKGAKKDNPNAPKTPIQKELPPNPVNIHPVMLLNQMKPGLTYVELSRVGNPPNTMFTLAVEIDGIEYSGTAKNKKDAKKASAKAALLALYNLTYPEDAAKQENMVVG
ncbi:Double-stranded RNA-specific editase B2 [Formica fusca]